ncbi:hypothetical protein [Pseudonocardia sp. McavD-2-B]|uniref:hypothetical protein n=1 Tax=Pseudonocardia sp. McavD-2-B TaxID=2954499 RepID=UPI00209807C6|nr:hypothetical protein [Pseudonocardia sp. McavD-2-B]MCO7195634.1 hypothetical protein [Pseudonocardia sp. McavD-2-B]
MNETGSNYFTSVIRTVIPTAWGTALAWLVSVGILDQAVADGPGEAVGGFLVPLAIGLYYLAARWIDAQPWAAPWLSRLLLGAASQPAYVPPASRSTQPPISSAEPFTAGSDRPREW